MRRGGGSGVAWKRPLLPNNLDVFTVVVGNPKGIIAKILERKAVVVSSGRFCDTYDRCAVGDVQQPCLEGCPDDKRCARLLWAERTN